ncbi:hypothetical protein [Actinacidiphila sp. ITFR-21]|uniref:hypothetical protein n=1 Tax=Actinacidiphila sp. ITFR-21 TaxID=3075199 RepID=UPI00288AA8CF|nr:hypothetical protein [Streptomyces sp. ITFR-21]WNI19235.1 hypothetical protein RLT57_29270 [Streptomyces sp. ITFR-21]
MADLPESLVALQRRVDAAWAAVETHRQQVDARRRAQAVPVRELAKWQVQPLPVWTPGEDEEHTRLMGIVTAAAEALHAGIAEAGLTEDYATVQGLHAAAREA